MRMTSVVCNVPVLSQNDSTCLHDMKVTSLRYLDAKFHHPSPKIKKIPKNTNGQLAIPALAGLLVLNTVVEDHIQLSILPV